jgi:hypothetical protein
LPEFAQADNQPRIRLDMQKQFYGVQPRAVLVHDCGLAAIVMPSAQEALHRRGQVRVAAVEGDIELGKKERVVTDHAPNAQQRVAQGRALAFALYIGMLGKQLA